MRANGGEAEAYPELGGVVAGARIRECLDRAKKIAQADSAVLICGETGSGKEMIARAVHAFSRRNAREWIDVNCAALPESLAESELFGYERGAFSGAATGKPGLFELAHRGTLFLDEVAELSPLLQVKLLRILDGAPYYRLGGTRKVSVDVRIVAATNRNLRQLGKERLFREDLYYRLGQTTISVPPLRERKDEIEPLAVFFLKQVRPGTRIGQEAVEKLEGYWWPGNIRELRNVITLAGSLCEDGELQASDVHFESEADAVSTGEDTTSLLESIEKAAVLRMLERTDGHRQKAASALGISKRTLSRRLRDYGAVQSRTGT